MARYLITGGAGFIGSNLVHRLVGTGDSVTVLDNLSTGRWENLAALDGKFGFVSGDICDLSLVKKVLAGVDYVLHQGALPSVPRSVQDPLATNRHNVEGTLNLLWAAKELGVKRIVLASSSSVYGDTEELPKHEGMIPRPLSPYAVSKLAGEHYAAVFHRLYGLPVVVLRYFNVFGPRQNPQSQYAAAVPRFIFCALKGAKVPIYGDGLQSRDFTFVENVVDANLLACTSPHAVGGLFNVSGGRRHTLLDLVRTLGEIVGTEVRVEHLPTRAGDVRHSEGSTVRAGEGLGYAPRFDLKAGLTRTLEFFRGTL